MISWMWMCLHATGWANGQWMEWLWLCCTGSMQLSYSQVIMQYIYTTVREYVCVCMWEREKKKRRERENKGDWGRNKEPLASKTTFSFGFQAWMESTPASLQPTQPTKPTTLQWHYVTLRIAGAASGTRRWRVWRCWTYCWPWLAAAGAVRGRCVDRSWRCQATTPP